MDRYARYAVNPDKPHAAIPVEGSLRTDITKQFASVWTCRHCGRDIIQRIAHMGQDNHYAHLRGAFKGA